MSTQAQASPWRVAASGATGFFRGYYGDPAYGYDHSGRISQVQRRRFVWWCWDSRGRTTSGRALTKPQAERELAAAMEARS